MKGSSPNQWKTVNLLRIIILIATKDEEPVFYSACLTLTDPNAGSLRMVSYKKDNISSFSRISSLTQSPSSSGSCTTNTTFIPHASTESSSSLRLNGAETLGQGQLAPLLKMMVINSSKASMKHNLKLTSLPFSSPLPIIVLCLKSQFTPTPFLLPSSVPRLCNFAPANITDFSHSPSSFLRQTSSYRHPPLHSCHQPIHQLPLTTLHNFTLLFLVTPPQPTNIILDN